MFDQKLEYLYFYCKLILCVRGGWWWWCFLISIFAEYIHSIYITGDGQWLLLWKC